MPELTEIWIGTDADGVSFIYAKEPTKTEHGGFAVADGSVLVESLAGWDKEVALPPPGECWCYLRRNAADKQAAADLRAKISSIRELLHLLKNGSLLGTEPNLQKEPHDESRNRSLASAHKPVSLR